MAQSRWVRQGGALQNGAALREHRIRRKLNLPQAAALIGCHPKALSNLEREERGASEVMLQKIADAYGTEREALMKASGSDSEAA